MIVSYSATMPGRARKNFVFPLWDAPNIGHVLVPQSINSSGEYKIFARNELEWSDILQERTVCEASFIKKCCDVENFMETAKEAALSNIYNILNEVAVVPDKMPKTPHTLRKPRTKRGITKKKSSVCNSTIVRRATRSTMKQQMTFSVIAPSAGCRMSCATEAETLLMSLATAPATTKRRKKEKLADDKHDSLNSSSSEAQNSFEMQDANSKGIPKVKKLIKLHENKITKANKSDSQDESDKHSSGHLVEMCDSEGTVTNKDAQDRSSTLVELEQPVTNCRLQVAENAADSRTKRRSSSARKSLNMNLAASKKSIARKSAVERRSLKEVLRRSLENDGPLIRKAIEKNHDSRRSVELTRIQENCAVVMVESIARDVEQSGCETDGRDASPLDRSQVTDTTIGTSTSVCSSSAATIDLEEENVSQFNMKANEQMETSTLVLTISCSEDELEKPESSDAETTKPAANVLSKSKRRSSVKVLGGVAAQRRSIRQSLRTKVHVSKQDAQQTKKMIVEESGEDSPTDNNANENETAESGHATVSHEEAKVPARPLPRPKIAKPVVKPKPKLKRTSTLTRSAGAMKRTRSNRAAFNTSVDAVNRSNHKTPSPPQHKKTSPEWVSPDFKICTATTSRSQRPRNAQTSSFLNRSTAASRAKRTPVKPSPAQTRSRLLVSPLLRTPKSSNISTTVQSFLIRNTPEKQSKEGDIDAKKKILEEKARKEEERKRKLEEVKQAKANEAKKKRAERTIRANHLREMKEKAERERQDQLQDKWAQRIADADRTKTQRKVEENAKMQKQMEKMAKAEARRREEEMEKLRRLKEQEEEKEKRSKQHLNELRIAEEQRIREKRLEEERREEQRLEEERIRAQKLDEERVKVAEEEERLRRKKEQEEIERARRKRELEAAAEAAAKKKKQEERLKLKQEQREAAREKKMEEMRLAKEKANRVKEEQKKIKEAQKKAKEEERKQREEQARLQREEEELARENEEARRIEMEAKRLREVQERQRAKEEEAARQKMLAAKKKKEELRRKVEEERKIKEEERKQQRIRDEQERQRQKREEQMRKLQEVEVKLQNMEQTQSTMNRTQTIMFATPKANNNINVSIQNDSNNYDMTPRGPHRPMLPSTATDYNIDDMRSDDSTDNEDEPKKKVPKWAKGAFLLSSLVKQHYNELATVDQIFDGLLKPVDLSTIFKHKLKDRYFKRTSSAHWKSPVMPPGHISFTSPCKGFD